MTWFFVTCWSPSLALTPTTFWPLLSYATCSVIFSLLFCSKAVKLCRPICCSSDTESCSPTGCTPSTTTRNQRFVLFFALLKFDFYIVFLQAILLRIMKSLMEQLCKHLFSEARLDKKELESYFEAVELKEFMDNSKQIFLPPPFFYLILIF